MVRVEVEALERVVGEQETTVEVHPFGERRDDRRASDADRRLLHAAEERAEPELARPLEHRTSRGDPAAFRELHVDARDDPNERVEVFGQHAALVRDDRQGRSILEPREVAVGTSGEWLLDELDTERDDL